MVDRTALSGFSVLELLVAMSLSGILLLLGLPNFATMRAQLEVGQDARALVHYLGEIRSQANRLRTDVRVEFQETGFTWDIDDDGDIDGRHTFFARTGWQNDLPSDLLFNGLGLARGIGSEETFTLRNGSSTLSVTVNANGHVHL